MANVASRLDQAIKSAGVPILGVSIGLEDDKSTWRVNPPSLQGAAQPVIDAFTEPTAQQLADEQAVQDTTRKELKAVALALWECIPNPTMTKAQLQARAIAIYKSL